jgi:hypothetical protein
MALARIDLSQGESDRVLASSQSVRHATCECGQLRITVTGEPEHVHACTCTKCQRRSGSVMTFSAWFPEGHVTVHGQTASWQPHGPGAEKVFCPVCGGGGYVRTGPYLPHCVAIRVGTFADPDFPPPTHVHWWASRPRWLEDLGLLEHVKDE